MSCLIMLIDITYLCQRGHEWLHVRDKRGPLDLKSKIQERTFQIVIVLIGSVHMMNTLMKL